MWLSESGSDSAAASPFQEWVLLLITESSWAVRQSRSLRVLSRSAIDQSRRARSWSNRASPVDAVAETARSALEELWPNRLPPSLNVPEYRQAAIDEN